MIRNIQWAERDQAFNISNVHYPVNVGYMVLAERFLQEGRKEQGTESHFAISSLTLPSIASDQI